MKIIIPGGTGQIGRILAKHFYQQQHDVVVLSRRPSNLSQTPWRIVHWDGETLGPWANEIDNADIVINLAGYSVNCRYNKKNRRLIKQSRVRSTEAIGRAIAQAVNPPELWLQAGTATIYAHRYDAANDELTGILGGQEDQVPNTWQFSTDVAQSWEAAVNKFNLPHTRTVIMRAAMSMSPDKDGVFDVLLGLARRGLGGRHGHGRQYVSWIHDQDYIRAVEWVINHPELSGPINFSAPNPLPNRDFMAILRQTCLAPFAIPSQNWMLEIGALFMRTETELLLKSRRVIPTRLQDSGFTFLHPTWETAAENLYNRWNGQRGHFEIVLPQPENNPIHN